jgi:hypothetical protein
VIRDNPIRDLRFNPAITRITVQDSPGSWPATPRRFMTQSEAKSTGASKDRSQSLSSRIGWFLVLFPLRTSLIKVHSRTIRIIRLCLANLLSKSPIGIRHPCRMRAENLHCESRGRNSRVSGIFQIHWIVYSRRRQRDCVKEASICSTTPISWGYRPSSGLVRFTRPYHACITHRQTSNLVRRYAPERQSVWRRLIRWYFTSRVLMTEISQRIRTWFDDNKAALPDLKSGKRWLTGYGWDQNILPGEKYPTAVFLMYII